MMLDFPAPDGAATMNRVPRTGPGIRDSGFGIREDKSLPQHYEANRNRFCESRIPNSQSRLLNVLHLLADLVDQHLQLHRDVAGARVDGFRAQGVGFAVELLQQEVQARSEEHTSELQSLMRISYAVFYSKKKNNEEGQKPKKRSGLQETISDGKETHTTRLNLM